MTRVTVQEIQQWDESGWVPVGSLSGPAETRLGFRVVTIDLVDGQVLSATCGDCHCDAVRVP
jgi:hypothetical protein